MDTLIEDAPPIDGGDNAYRVSAAELRRFVTRIEASQEQIKDLQGEIKDEYAHAKARGYDVKVLRKLIAERKRDSTEVSEEAAVLELYRDALSGWKDSPLGQYEAKTRKPPDTALDFLNGLGTMVELTDAERTKGYTVAFVDKRGTRCTLGPSEGPTKVQMAVG
jgi:uncharacterized protein (UPF0335 family)